MKRKIIADICLYGNHEKGSGYIIAFDSRFSENEIEGTGELKEGRNFTEAIWEAQKIIRQYSRDGYCRVFNPTGKFMAYLRVTETKYYGDLKFQPAIMYEVTI